MNLDDEALMTSYRDTGSPELLAELRLRHLAWVTEVMTRNLPVQFEAAIEDVFRAIERNRSKWCGGSFLVWKHSILQAVNRKYERNNAVVHDPTLRDQLEEVKRLMATMRPSDQQLLSDFFLPRIVLIDEATMSEASYARLQAALRVLRNSDGIALNNQKTQRSTSGEHQ